MNSSRSQRRDHATPTLYLWYFALNTFPYSVSSVHPSVRPTDRHSIRERDENEADKNRGCGGQFSSSPSGEVRGQAKSRETPSFRARYRYPTVSFIYRAGKNSVACMRESSASSPFALLPSDSSEGPSLHPST